MSGHNSRPFCPHFRCPCTCRPPTCLNFHHHHHHHPFFFFCPFHSRVLCPNFHTHFPAFSFPPPVRGNPEPGSLLPTTVSSVPGSKDGNFSTTGLREGTGELYEEVKEEEEEEEEEDPVFVMTDEWMEFFAKSEAKRRLNKQAKKRRNK